MKAQVVIMLLYCACLQAQDRRSPAIAVRPLEAPGRVEVVLRLSPEQQVAFAGTDSIDFEAGSQHLDLRLVDTTGVPGPPIFSRYRTRGKDLVLQPRYPLMSGGVYRAAGTGPNGRSYESTYRVPGKAPGTAPTVRQVYPSGKILPANCLKFYVHFSQPMREGREIFDHIEIRDETGKTINDAWRRTELWSPDARRLTLWIHPGRIKQGVNLREDFGPVLKPHQHYQLVVHTRVRDAAGTALAENYVKRFQTRAEDHSRPLPARWQLSHPVAKSRDALRITFDKPLDRAQLDRFLTVHGKNGPIPGTLQVNPGEEACAFTPDAPWPEGPCQLRVDGRLEDLAGNTPLRVFDTDLEKAKIEPPVLTFPIPFSRGS
ncbi:MAG: hypothetical protein VCG02_04255 [Verrucomicrobiota bacterium]